MAEKKGGQRGAPESRSKPRRKPDSASVSASLGRPRPGNDSDRRHLAKSKAGKAGSRPGSRNSTAAAKAHDPGRGLELTDNPRQAAWRTLKDCREGRTPEEALASHGLLLSQKDLALATAMVYEVLRHQSRLESLAASRLSSGRASPDLLLVLNLGLAQLLYFQRLGDHAVVSETVALAKAVVPGRHGLVNAILRGLLRDREAGAPWPPQLKPIGDSTGDLAQNHSYPKWLVKKVLARFGPEEAEELLAAGNHPTPPTLRANPLKISREDLAIQLPFECRLTRFSPWGLAASNFSGRPDEWPGFTEGLFALQDEASQLAALIAGSLPGGAKVLDACSGLGGKALALAAVNPRAKITARDKDEAKLILLKREAERLGCQNIEVAVGDLLAEDLPPEQFDLVLVDAPCSGLGVIRRRPDLKWNKKEEDIPRLAELQLKLLNSAAKGVRPGGRLLYGVCTFTIEEGPLTAANFLKANPGFQAAPAEAWPEDLRPHLGPEVGLSLLPHRHRTDGFFWALFLKS